MSLEDELRAVMHEHDREAPTRSALRIAPSRRARYLPAVASMLIVMAVVAGTFVVHRSQETASSGAAVRCPERFDTRDGWVPAPATVPEPDTRLVPADTPRAAVVCSFARTGSPTSNKVRRGRLTGVHRLLGDLRPIQRTLSNLPKSDGKDVPCPLYAADTDYDNYLVGLRYRTGIVWVAAPGNHCDGSTNGQFASRTNLRAYALDLYKTRRALTPPKGKSCASADGRLGDEKRLLPSDAVSAEVCVTGAGQARSRLRATLTGDKLSELARRVDGLSAAPGQTCQAPGSDDGPRYLLVFRYREGPSVVLNVDPFCRPNVLGGVLRAEAPQDFLDYVAAIR